MKTYLTARRLSALGDPPADAQKLRPVSTRRARRNRTDKRTQFRCGKPFVIMAADLVNEALARQFRKS
jgi:hypothetical protein